MLPKKYLQRIESFLTKTEFEQTIKGYSEDRVCSFRINTLKSDQDEVESFLCTKNISFQRVSFLPFAYMVDKKDEFALKGSTLFYEGKIYVQGLASQLPVVILHPENNMRILDVTAAPGSKTTQMAALMNNTGTIVACEKHQIRHDKMGHNIRLQGVTNIETQKKDALEYMSELEKESFDAILLDAPCSAEGRFKLSDERSYGFWTLGNIRDKSKLQSTLLEASVPLLKKWGVLVYSTCTLAPEENEGVISNILEKHPELVLAPIDTVGLPHAIPGIKSFEERTYHADIWNTVRILPSDLTEGFYLAKIQKV